MLPPQIVKWFESRGVASFVLGDYGIDWNGTHIVIPVHAKDGTFLFNKYRRDPAKDHTDQPKYLYDKGANAALYGAHLVRPEDKRVVVTEGELDALRLNSQLLRAVSSTGGAQSFSQVMGEQLLGIETTILFDQDDAGITGSFNAQKAMPWAKVAWFPEWMKERGDVTDFLKERPFIELLDIIAAARRYELPNFALANRTKEDLKVIKKNYEEWLAPHVSEENMHISDGNEWAARRSRKVIDMFVSELEKIRRMLSRPASLPDGETMDRMARAKSVPIDRFITFNRQKKAKCIWHDEETPSMHWYEKQGKVFCHGCSTRGDTIDVVCQLEGVGMKEAIDIILRG